HSLDTKKKKRRPSIIAHSFGTYIVGYAMTKYSHIRFDKIILCGCILPPAFDWTTLSANDQFDRALNDRGLDDAWVGMVGNVLSDGGPSGRDGFANPPNGVVEERSSGRLRHSDFF